MVCAWLLWTERADEVWLVPTFQHAFDKPLAPFALRLRFCRAMAADLGPLVRVQDIESRLPRPSFTLETLQALAAEHPQHELRLVVGADVLQQTEHWHRWDLIEERFKPILVGRDGFPPVADAPVFPGVSSTEIRARLAANQPVDYLLTRSVAALVGAGSLPGLT